jgi:hypothetical protein
LAGERGRIDLPEDIGHWNSVFKRFRRRLRRGVFDEIFNALADEPDFADLMVDGTMAKVHRPAAGPGW